MIDLDMQDICTTPSNNGCKVNKYKENGCALWPSWGATGGENCCKGVAVVHNDDFDHGHLHHIVACHCKVVKEWAFGHVRNSTQQDYCDGGGAVAVEEHANKARENGAISYNEDASKFWALGSVFDDDNDSAPDNVTSLMIQTTNECVYKLQNSVSHCDCRLRGANDV